MKGYRVCQEASLYDASRKQAEARTLAVTVLTLITMVVEIAAGYAFNSMALMADGWHMSSHAVAMGLAVVAYMAARRYASDRRFSFGTWKIEVLGGFVSALFLLGVALMMVVMSVDRLLHPTETRFAEAMMVAVAGLVINLLSAWLLGHGHDHGHGHGHAHAGVNDDHDHDHDHDHHGHDLNLRGAYLHVLADALTSVFAILALLGGMMFGWNWLDPFMGIVGAVVVAVWAKGLLRDTSRILLDAEMDHPVTGKVASCLETAGVDGRIEDLHVWRVGKTSFACMVTLSRADRAVAEMLEAQLQGLSGLVHVTVSVRGDSPSVQPRSLPGHGHGRC